MLRRLTARILQAVPVIIIVAVLTFLLMHLLPGDPAVVIAGQVRADRWWPDGTSIQAS